MKLIFSKGLKKRERWFKDDEYFTEVFNALMTDFRKERNYHGREMYCKRFKTEYILAVLKFLYTIQKEKFGISENARYEISIPGRFLDNSDIRTQVTVMYDPNENNCVVRMDNMEYLNRYFRFIIETGNDEYYLIPSCSNIIIDNDLDKNRSFEKNFINVFLNFVDRYMHYNVRKDAFVCNEVQ